MRTLNFNDTVEAVREIINSVGADFVYTDSDAYGEEEMCLYVYEDEPSCIVGRFLVSEGHGTSILENNEGLNAQDMLEVLGYNMSDPQTDLASCWLLRLQEHQDALGTTWGDAFDAAQEFAKEWDLS